MGKQKKKKGPNKKNKKGNKDNNQYCSFCRQAMKFVGIEKEVGPNGEDCKSYYCKECDITDYFVR